VVHSSGRTTRSAPATASASDEAATSTAPAAASLALADDDAAVCEMYERGLSALGYDIVCASSAARAKKFLEKEKPDVIIALGGGSPMDAAKLIWLLYERPER